MKNWRWLDTFFLLAILLVIVASAIGVRLLTAPHDVDYYYISHSGAQNTTTCVYAHWTWHVDEIAFCTDDAQKAVEFTARANAGLRGK